MVPVNRQRPRGFLELLAQTVYENAVDKEFWQSEEFDHLIGTKLNMIVTEVAEVTEAYRKDMGKDKVVEEIADILVRLLDLYYGLASHGVIDKNSLTKAVLDKMKYNQTRPKKHGNRF